MGSLDQALSQRQDSAAWQDTTVSLSTIAMERNKQGSPEARRLDLIYGHIA